MKQPYFLARQPIVNEEKKVVMYETFLRSKENPEKYPENLTPQKATFIVLDLISSVGYRKIVGDRKIMINFPVETILIKTYLELLNPEKTVINILKPTLQITQKQWGQLEKKLEALKKEGFELAFNIDLFDISEAKFLGLKFADYVVVEFSKLKKAQNPVLIKKTCIATKIENEKQFEEAKKRQCDLFEGFYFGKPEKVDIEIPLYAYVSTILHALRAIEKHEDLKTIEEIIKTDPALVGRILKFVNSAIFYLPVEVKSLRQALALLGLSNLRRFLLLLLTIDLAETLQIPVKEYRKLIISALVAEELAKRVGADKEAAFLGGLFVGSDLVFEIPPEKMAVDLGLASEILEGYLGDEPKLHCIFLISKTLAFELNTDENFNECLKLLHISEKELKEIYNIAKKRASELPL
jgi:EAL and modified HD-GYP domain-containing signal transduction protein